MYQQQQQPSIPVSGEITGWFGRARTRLFGQRDKVEEQMRDIARQGSAGARVSHWFAGLLIILFSLASLVSLGGDAFRAVVASLQHGVLDIPNAIALGVTALLVPAMDVAVLQAASVYRLLRMRRAELGDMWLHALVIGGISVIEAGTYCYMAGVYEHPVGGVAWTLIIARALAAPLIAVYLAMARPLPVTSRDILAQVELGAGQGVIRDVSKIANDPTAPLSRKMELFGASAVMGEHEEDKLNRLIAVAQKSIPPALPAGHSGVPSVKIHAAAMLPHIEPQAHYSAPPVPSYSAMHGDSVEYDASDDSNTYDYADEIDDEVDDDNGLFSTMKIPAVRPATGDVKQGGRDRVDSGPAKRNGNKIAPGLRKANAQLRAEAKRIRRGKIRDATYAVLDEWFADGAGASLSDRELARRVAGRVDFDVNPSGNTVARWRGPWQSSRAHKAAILATDTDDVPPMEPQELRELQEVW